MPHIDDIKVCSKSGPHAFVTSFVPFYSRVTTASNSYFINTCKHKSRKKVSWDGRVQFIVFQFYLHDSSHKERLQPCIYKMDII